MKNFRTWMAMVAVLAAVSMASAQHKEKKDNDKKAKPAYQRIVVFQFKASADEAARKKHMDDFAAFVKQVPVVLSYRAGHTVKGERKTEPEYHVMHYVTFATEEDIKTYDLHPAHQKFMEENRASWEKVFVSNGTIDKD